MTHHESVRLTVGEQSLDLGVEHATEGNNGINIAPLLKETGDVTYDPGFMNTANAKSAVTFIDGDQGILRYRGYAIEDLAEHSSFMEVAYLLIYGELPESKETLEAWETNILRHNMVHEDLKLFFNGFPRDAHPMPVLSSSVSGLSTFYPDSLDPHDPEQVHISTVRLLGKLPVLASYAFKKSLGQPFMYPHNSLNYVENFLRLCFGVPAEEYDIDPDVVKALDLLLMLHADHEQNASTSTVRLAGSSGANPFACIASGIACLWGPAHGGANEAALQMLMDLQKEGGVAKIGEFVKKVKDKNSGVKLMGFGHRVYKNYDPRAKLMQETTREVLQAVGSNDPLLELAKALEKIALEDEYFVSRKLYPNVDFYSGIVQRALGIPTSMFTCIFALARTVGWIAQWNEMISDPEQKIGRPRQLYNGPTKRDVVPIAKRK